MRKTLVFAAMAIVASTVGCRRSSVSSEAPDSSAATAQPAQTASPAPLPNDAPFDDVETLVRPAIELQAPPPDDPNGQGMAWAGWRVRLRWGAKTDSLDLSSDGLLTENGEQWAFIDVATARGVPLHSASESDRAHATAGLRIVRTRDRSTVVWIPFPGTLQFVGDEPEAMLHARVPALRLGLQRARVELDGRRFRRLVPLVPKPARNASLEASTRTIGTVVECEELFGGACGPRGNASVVRLRDGAPVARVDAARWNEGADVGHCALAVEWVGLSAKSGVAVAALVGAMRSGDLDVCGLERVPRFIHFAQR